VLLAVLAGMVRRAARGVLGGGAGLGK